MVVRQAVAVLAAWLATSQVSRADELDDWIKGTPKNVGPRLVVVGSFGADVPQFVDVNSAATSLLRFVPAAEATLRFTLNQLPAASALERRQVLESMIAVPGIDGIVDASTKGTFTIFAEANGALAAVGEGVSDLVSEGALANALGFNGIVLDVRGDLLLVMADAAALGDDVQGLVLNQAKGALAVSPDDDAAALAQVVQHRAGYASMRLVFTRVDRISPGQRVLLRAADVKEP